MRAVLAAVVALFVFAPAAHAQVTFTGVPASPTKQVTFDVGFSSPEAIRYDCVHVLPDLTTDPLPDCHSPFQFRELVDGPHELRVTATDAAGATMQGTATVVIDTVAPDVTFTGVPASPTNMSKFGIGFTADEPNVTFGCEHAFPSGGLDEFPVCESPFEMRELEDGTHELRVTAKDAAGNARTRVASVTIDTEPPAAAQPSQTGQSEFAFAGEAGATFECRLVGSGSDTGFVGCRSPQRYSELLPGDYTFSLLSIDAAGNRSAATSRPFSIAATPAATPEPAPQAMPAPAVSVLPAAPAAELGKTVVIRPLSGKVFVRRPGATTASEVTAAAAVAVGSEVDVRKGRGRLTAAAKGGTAAHRAEFFGGMFVVRQAADDQVELALSETLGSCAKKTGTRVRKLWGDGKGRFRTRGQNAVVTVRGTRWLVQDSCDGTLTRVSQGVVSVRDTVKRKTFLVRAGRKYLAAPKRK